MALYNLRNPAVKRLMKEAEELRYPTAEYYAQPLEDNLFEWHFTVRGPPKTDYEGGIYHGRISLPADYPMKPPSIILLTPNGRFETNKKICLSISGHHPESWQPSWSIRTALLAMIGFMPTHGNGAIGSLDYTPEERQLLASKSQSWKCAECGLVERFLNKKGMSFTSNSNEDEPVINIDTKEPCFQASSSNASCDSSNLSLKNGINDSGTFVSHSIEVNFNSQSEDYIKSVDCFEETNLVLRHKTDRRLTEETVVQQNQSSVEKSFSYSLVLIWVILFIITILFFRRVMYS